MRHAIRWIAAVLWLPTVDGHSYEIVTHAQITQQAYTMSVLSSTTTQQSLGLGPWIWNVDTPLRDIVDLEAGISLDPKLLAPFGAEHNYYDVLQNTTVTMRTGAPSWEDWRIWNYVNGAPPYQLSGWLMRGAIREDDYKGITKWGMPKTDTDPYATCPEVLRSVNHFFDPLRNIPLTYPGSGLQSLYAGCWSSPGTATIRTAPAWALGNDNPFVSTATRGTDPVNHFTIYDVHEAMWRAVTGQRFSDGGPITPSGAPATENDRRIYWATAFRALGDVLHLNEDMAQPQHTRNEWHSGFFQGALAPLAPYAGGPESAYEHRIEDRATGNPWTAQDLVGNTISSGPYPPLNFTAIAGDTVNIPNAFQLLSQFWSTNAGSGIASSNNAGAGLADYSNQGYFTDACNIGCTPYLLPNPNASAYAPVWEVTSAGATQYIKISVFDNYTHVSSPAIHMLNTNIWYSQIPSGTTVQKYAMNNTVYDDMASLLVPRAEAYATGIINYVFRGSMSITAPKEGAYGVTDQLHSIGFSKIKLTLVNTTNSITETSGVVHPQDMTGGSLMVVVRFHLNTCYTEDLQNEWSPTNLVAAMNCRSPQEQIATSNIDATTSKPFTNFQLAPGAANAVELSFAFSTPIPINATDLYLQVIYRGGLGDLSGSPEPDSVIIATADISEPSYVTLSNVGLYACFEGETWPLTVNGTIGPALAAATGWPETTPIPPLTLYNYVVSFQPNGPSNSFVSPLIPLIGVANSTGLAHGQFARVAVLVDSNAVMEYEASPCANCPGAGFQDNTFEPWFGGGETNEVVYDPGAVTFKATALENAFAVTTFSSTGFGSEISGPGCLTVPVNNGLSGDIPPQPFPAAQVPAAIFF
jgi:hypothetical protein